MSFNMIFIFKATLIKFLMLSLMFVSFVAFAEDEDDLEVDHDEVVEMDESLDEPVENHESEEVDEEEIEEPEQEQEQEVNQETHYESQAEEYDDVEREHAEQVEALEREYESSNAANDQNSYSNSRERYSQKRKNQIIKEDRTNHSSQNAEGLRSQNRYQESKILMSSKKSEKNTEGFECDPMVSIQAQNKLRFDILKELADEHNFEISMLESENKTISLEKNQPLLKVVESITRDMSVVLNFQKINDCNVLSAISVLDNSEWNNSGSSFRGGGSNPELSAKLQKYIPKFKSIRRVAEEDLEPISADAQEAREKMQEERRLQREESGRTRVLNDEIEGGDQLKAQYNVRGNNWKRENSDQLQQAIPDMHQYVQEVLDGERQPDMRAMTVRQRSEYMKVRRELRAASQNE